MQTCLNHLSIVEYHQRTLRQILRQMAETVVRDLTVTIDQQLRLVALSQGELSNALVGQWIVIVTDMYMLGFHAI